MNIIRLPFPLREYSDYSDQPLSDGELHQIESAGVDLLIYFYGTGSYEGSGKAIFKVGTKWGFDDFGHCSCYGPLKDDGTWRTGELLPIGDLMLKGTAEWRAEYSALFAKAVELGF